MFSSRGRKPFPWPLPAIAILLLLVGWVAIARADQFAETGGRYLRQQLLWSALGLASMLVATRPQTRMFMRLSYAALAVTLLFLAAVYWFPAVNGAQRWIRWGPFSLQPSEFAKLAFVMALARYLSHRKSTNRLPGLIPPLLLACLPIVLILKQPDLGTAMVFVPVLAIMLFAAGARTVDLAKFAIVGLLSIPLLWTQMSREQQSRVTALFAQAQAGERPADDGYQLYQSKQMLALGGHGGSLMFGDAVDDFSVYRLPEAHTDFIFSVVGERLGWLGAGSVLLLYSLLIWRGAIIAATTQDPFGQLLAVGITALFGVQALINTSMTVGLLPVVGLSLPLISYGGSGLLAHCVALGMLMRVGR